MTRRDLLLDGLGALCLVLGLVVALVAMTPGVSNAAPFAAIALSLPGSLVLGRR